MVDPSGALSSFAEEMDKATKLTPDLRASLMTKYVGAIEGGLEAVTKDGGPDWKARLAAMAEAKVLLRIDMKDQLALLARMESIVVRRVKIGNDARRSALDAATPDSVGVVVNPSKAPMSPEALAELEA